MKRVELLWKCDEQGNKRIVSEGIETFIEIDESNKELKNAKKFFRELIFNHFFEEWNNEVILVPNIQIQVPEVKGILEDLINVINAELKSTKDNPVIDELL